MILDFLIHKHECKHNHVPTDVDQAYCPDCGLLIQNKWYIARCNCCNIKRLAKVKYDEIIPETNYCPNCGSSEYYIQELDGINFTDLKYAILKRIVVPQENIQTSQIWVEKEESYITSAKLLEAK